MTVLRFISRVFAAGLDWFVEFSDPTPARRK